MQRDKPEPTPTRPSRLPMFASIEEEAAFWDTHDSTEFEDELEDAPNVRFTPPGTRSAVVIVPLDPATLGALRERARAGGMAPEALVRELILRHLASTG